MKITCISDTHNQHYLLNLKGGDVLIHAGDVSGRGSEADILRFLNWFEQQPYSYKIFIAGNHDFFFERESEVKIKSLIPENVIYLNDSGVTIEGINFWGSPVTPWFYDWAFNRQRGTEIKKHWDLIPIAIGTASTDVLITHGPPKNILDLCKNGERVGCSDLLEKINQVKPRIHIFGHIHESYGRIKIGETEFVNASVLDERYELVNEAVEIEI